MINHLAAAGVRTEILVLLLVVQLPSALTSTEISTSCGTLPDYLHRVYDLPLHLPVHLLRLIMVGYIES